MTEPMSLDAAADAMRQAMRETVRRHSILFLIQGALMVVAGAVALLSCGADILIPVAEAVFVWFVLNAMAKSCRRLPVVGPRLPW